MRAQRRDPRLDRGAAFRERDPRGCPVGECEPALGLVRSPGQRPPPRSVDGERRVLHELVVAEPLEPLLEGLHAAVVIERRTQCIDQAGDGVRLAGRATVADRVLGPVVGETPGHCTSVELGHQLGLRPLELVPEKLAEEVVVAVPLPLPVERHHEAVRALERLERLRRPGRLQHGVAETAAHPHQDRGALEELRFGFRQPREELEAEVLGHEPVAAGQVIGAHRARRPGLNRQRRQVQAGRPSFRSLGQLGDLAGVEHDTRRSKQQRGFVLVQPELSDADLAHRALHPPAGEGQGRLLSARDRDLRAGRDVPGELGEHVLTGRIGDSVEIVQRQHQRLLTGRRTRRRHGGRVSTRSIHPARTTHRARQATRLDPVDRSGDRAQQHQCVVVSSVERDPGERTRVGLRPAREQRRLAVPGGGDDDGDGNARRDTAVRSDPSSPRCRAGSTAPRA